MRYLSLTDLFLVGLALDITGAIMLAMGLLLSARSIVRLNTMWGLNKGAHEDRCWNRVNGEFGAAFLVAGFALQAVGYGLEIAGVPSETSTCRLIAAVAMSVIAAGLAWAAWGLFRRRRFNAILAAAERARPEIADEINATQEAREQVDA